MQPIVSELKRKASYILRIHVHVPMGDKVHIINDKEALIFINQKNIDWLLENEKERNILNELYKDSYIENFKQGRISNKTKNEIIKYHKKLVDENEIAKKTKQTVETVKKVIDEYRKKNS
jgi:hypothetical protein